jgi:hypothetical protein
METKANNQFLVALDGLELSESQRSNIQSGIQSVVMKELAQIDNLEAFSVSKKPFSSTSIILKPGFLHGIWWDKISKSLNYSKNAGR